MTAIDFRPKYITFDCYGTLTHFQMGQMARDMFADHIAPEAMSAFVKDFENFRFDEVGCYKPYAEVIGNALSRTCKLWSLEYKDEYGQRMFDAVPTWGPHADVPEGLTRVAREYPLVILSNADDSQIQHNVDKLGAPFHAVYTAQQAQAYKPRFQAFEYMFDQLGCGPDDILHVSSSMRYDLMPAHDLRVKHKVYVNRGYEPAVPFYRCHEIKDISGLPGLLGL